ncbi:MAG: hypothetical protein NDJ90_14125 [Oligoflexia bacterium]|nr:hypothetical protein [Oligoflexia bacterium]
MRWLPLLSALLAVLFAALFVADLSGYFSSTRNPVALVSRADGSTRRLPKDQLLWDRAPVGALLGTGDTISTGEASSAKIVFHSGAELELEAASMVVLGSEKDEIKLSFVSGGGKVRVAKTATKKIVVARAAPGSTMAKKPQPAPKATPAVAGQPGTTAGQPTPATPIAAETDPFVEVTETDEIVPLERAAPEAAKKVAEQTRQAPVTPPPPAPPKLAIAPIQEKRALASEAAPVKSLLSARTELNAMSALPPAPGPRFPLNEAAITAGDGTELRWDSPEIRGEASPDLSENLIVSYEVTLRPESKDAAAAPVVLKTASTALPLQDVAPGRYRWSVRSVSRAGKLSPASSPRWLEVKAPAIKLPSKPRAVSVEVELNKPEVYSVEVE